MAILAVIVGVVSSISAILFQNLIELFQSIAYGSSGNLLLIIKSLPWYSRVGIPALGGLIVGPVVYFIVSEAKGHGIPEVMESVTLRSGIIRKRVVLVKTLASAISIGTGASVGRIGPIVQIGSAIGSSLGQVLKVSNERIRTLVGCGAAAGIAAIFNAPIAGAMFALEIIMGDFGMTRFSPIVISSVCATVVSRHYLGDFPAFIVPKYQLISPWELPLYVLMGFFCAVIAVLFTKTLYKTEDIFNRIKIPNFLKPSIGGIILGMIGLMYPYVLGVGFESISVTLMQQMTWSLLIVLVFVKILATSITLGSGGSGGILAPSLFMGAMAGGFFGNVVHFLFPKITASSGAYSIVGMGALVSGTTHGPLSAILILFEMTGDYKIILPLMITCIISTLASGHLFKESIYTLKLARRGVNIRAGKEVNILMSIPVSDVMTKNIETMHQNLRLGSLRDKVSRSKFNSFPVTDVKNNLKGVISHIDYQNIIFDEDLKDLVIVKDIATEKIETIRIDQNLYDALEKITQRDYSILPVVSRDDPLELIGVLSRRDIISAYNKAVIKKSVFNK